MRGSRVLAAQAGLLLLAAASAAAADFSGYAEVAGFAYAERARAADPWAEAQATLFAKAGERLGPVQLTAALRAEDRSSGEEAGAWFDPADRGARRSPVSVRELWVRVPLAPAVDLQLGRFELGWGKTDGYSPADAFLPRDLTDPFADEKLPLWAARLSAERGAVRLEAVAVPVTTPWRLPPLGSRGAPLPAASAAGLLAYDDREDEPPRAGFGALRLLAAAGDWDLGAWGRFGVRPAPLLDLRLDEARPRGEGVTVPVERRYAREEAVGVEVSRVVGAWVVRGEAAALFSRDRDLGDALVGTASAERAFGDDTLLVTLAGTARKPPVDAALLFDRALLPAAIVAWHRAAPWGSARAVWTAGLGRGDGLLKGEIGYDLTDAWRVAVGGELPYGDEEGPLGALAAARRAHLSVRRSW